MKPKNELIWMIATIATAIAITAILAGTEGFFSWSLDVNIHDTYLVIDPINALLSISASLVFIVYLVKILIEKFKSNFTNIIFLISNGYLISHLTYLITIATALDSSNYTQAGWTIYPPMSTLPEEQAEIDQIDLRLSLILIQMVLIIIFGLVAFKSGLKRKKQSG